jgi:hypothetical protein
VKVVPSAQGATGALAKDLDPAAEAAGQSAGKKFSTGLKLGITAASTVLVGAVAKLFTDAIQNASDLNEAGTAVSAIFGDATQGIQTWAKSAATNLGQSQLEALNAAKTFGVYGAAAGLSNEANAEFSTGLATLASDFASFHNVSPAEAIEAIGAGLRGESEPLRRFGVLLDDASLRAEAMAQGIYDGNGPLTAQQKILAANALIYKQAGAAQGDFTRTADGLANQQRIFNAELTNLSATLGTALLPAITTVVTAAADLVAFLSDNPSIVYALAIALGVLVVAIIAVNVAMWAMAANPIVLAIAAIIVMIGLLIAGLVLLIMNWDAVIAWVTQVWLGFVSWLTQVTAGFISWWNGVWNGFASWLNQLWVGFTNWIKSVWNGFVNWLMGIVASMVSWWIGIWTNFGNAVNNAWNALVNFIRTAWSNVSSWLMGAINGFFGWWNGIWNTVGDVIRTVFGGVASFLQGVWNGIVGTIKGAINTIIGAINGAIGAINGIIGAVGGLVGIDAKIPKIPKLARGGTLTSSGSVIVGERGPELLSLPKGASVDPDIEHAGGPGKVIHFHNYAPLGQNPAQALTQFANRAEVVL